jgi:hypothetical protein
VSRTKANVFFSAKLWKLMENAPVVNWKKNQENNPKTKQKAKTRKTTAQQHKDKTKQNKNKAQII